MKIKFTEFVSYDVNYVSYNVVVNTPVDIVLVSNKTNIEEIAKLSRYGYNIRKFTREDAYMLEIEYDDRLYIGLYARLGEFTINNMHKFVAK